MYKAEVVADESGTIPNVWVTNDLLFATAREASEYARDLALRWTAVRDWRVREATREEIATGARP